MTTRRTPISRPLRTKITPQVVEAFKRMEAARLSCTCAETEIACSACEEYWNAHSVLHGALGCKPWEWPCIEYPDAENPYPAGCHAANHWEQRRAARPQAFELFRALQEAER